MLIATVDEWVAALRLHADVFEIADDFDLEQVCAQIRPDLMILDAVNWARPWPLTIANARAFPEIPRVLYLNSDPHDPMRALTMRMVGDLGIEAVFVTAEAYRQQMPELRSMHCYFPHQFFDNATYRDYGLPKTIPVSVFGGYLSPSFYPWRARLVAEIQHVVPTLIYTHPGYRAGQTDPFAVRGEDYARLLNRCSFSAADTTRLGYLVRKHLEIPASGSVLIAPEAEALKRYGFVDLENCLLGEGPDLYEKITRIAADPPAYERIRQAGMALVHGRYTQKTWTFFLDWLERRLLLQSGEMIQQEGLYGPFQIVPAKLGVPSVDTPSSGDNQMTEILRQARSAILSGRGLEAAEARLLDVVTWTGHIAEPWFLMGLVYLLRGDAISAALAMGRRAESQGAIDESLVIFDPVEIAWLMLIARITANGGLEQAMRERAVGLDHVSLRRVLWLLDGTAITPGVDDVMVRQTNDLLSVHWLGDEDFTEWCDLVRRVFTANHLHLTALPATQRSLSTAA